MTRILLVDDHEIMLDGYTSILATEEQLQIAGKAHNGLEVITFLETQSADLVLLDINMPKMDGLETARYLCEHRPGIRVIVFTMLNNLSHVKQMVENYGVKGYMLKNCSKRILLEAIEKVMNDGVYFDKTIQGIIESGYKQIYALENQSVVISQRETEIIRMVALGMSTDQIAEELYLSPHTVQTHRKNINFKLQLHSPADVTKFAIKNGILPANLV